MKLDGFHRKIGKALKGGGASIIVTAILSNLLRIVSSMTLTRLLDVKAFGIVGLVTTVTYIFNMISDIGVQPFVIRHARGDEREFLDEIWTLRLIRSCILTIAMAALANPIAILLGKPEFYHVIMIWSFSFLLDGLSSMSFATAVRERKLWRMAILDLSTSVFSFIASVILALIYRSYWALIAAVILASGFKAVVSYLMFPNSSRRLRWNKESANEIWEFSRFVAPSSLAAMMIMQADKLILVRLMPIALFSLFALASTIASTGPSLASNYARRVLFPIYSEGLRNGVQSLKTLFYQSRRLPTLLYMAAMGGIGGAAKLIVAILYDHRYAGVAQFLQIIIISAVFSLVNTSSEEMLVAVGRLRSLLHAKIAQAFWLIIGTVLALLLTNNILVLVAVFGTSEIAVTVVYWYYLRIEKVLSVRQEILGLSLAAISAMLCYECSDFIIAHFSNFNSLIILRNDAKHFLNSVFFNVV